MIENEFPEAFVSRLKTQFGEEADAMLQALQLSPAVSVRKREVAPIWDNEEVIPLLSRRSLFTTKTQFYFGSSFSSGGVLPAGVQFNVHRIGLSSIESAISIQKDTRYLRRSWRKILVGIKCNG
jgi:hypothetical protein